MIAGHEGLGLEEELDKRATVASWSAEKAGAPKMAPGIEGRLGFFFTNAAQNRIAPHRREAVGLRGASRVNGPRLSSKASEGTIGQ